MGEDDQVVVFGGPVPLQLLEHGPASPPSEVALDLLSRHRACHSQTSHGDYWLTPAVKHCVVSHLALCVIATICTGNILGFSITCKMNILALNIVKTEAISINML